MRKKTRIILNGKKVSIFALSVFTLTACSILLTDNTVYADTVEAEEMSVSEVNVSATTVYGGHYDLEPGGKFNPDTGYIMPDGTQLKNAFFCDGTYTYFLQNDGTPMTNYLTYHPDGEHIIYFDAYGHEVFDSFATCGPQQTYYFGALGYLAKNELIGAYGNFYYMNDCGLMSKGWFQFPDGNYGFGDKNGKLKTDGWGTDPYGRQVFFNWNGTVSKGLMTDGMFYYHMDETDGHFLGQWLCDGVNIDGRALEIMNSINSYRNQCGRQPVVMLPVLNQCAQTIAGEMGSMQNGRRPNGKEVYTVFEDFGVDYDHYQNCGFASRSNSGDPDDTIGYWKRRVRLLDPGYKFIGIGVAQNGEETNWFGIMTRSSNQDENF